MQLRKTSAFALYIGSYLPLGPVLLIQDLDLKVVRAGFCRPFDWTSAGCRLPLLHPWLSLGTVGLRMICLIVTTWTLDIVPTPTQIKIVEAKHIPADLINYVIPHIIPFMGLYFASPARLLGFGVFFLWTFWITYRSGQIILNPILIVFGWRLFEIKYR